jgi:hypothetical protein
MGFGRAQLGTWMAQRWISILAQWMFGHGSDVSGIHESKEQLRLSNIREWDQCMCKYEA